MQMATSSILDGLSYETISYLPAGGGSRSISALLEYPGPGPVDGLAGGSRPIVDIFVKNDSASGIASSEINTGGDKIQLPQRIGLTARTVSIMRIIAHDKSIMHLRCQ